MVQVVNLSVTVNSSKQQVGGKAQGGLKRMHKISTLIQLVDKATRNFAAVGEEIARENPQFEVSMRGGGGWCNRLYHTIQQRIVDVNLPLTLSSHLNG